MANDDLIETKGDVLKAGKDLATLFISCLLKDGTLFFAGNGGSAADAQHIAAEYVGRARVGSPRKNPLRALALTTDTSIITAIANDFGFDHVFERQVRALGRVGDILVCHTTSGNSKNLLHAAHVAHEMGMITIALTGQDSGSIGWVADYIIRVTDPNQQHVQICHMAIEHHAVLIVDEYFAEVEAHAR